MNADAKRLIQLVFAAMAALLCIFVAIIEGLAEPWLAIALGLILFLGYALIQDAINKFADGWMDRWNKES